MDKQGVLKLCGLWAEQGRNGSEVLEGRLNRHVKLRIVHNATKRNDADPDAFAVLIPTNGEENYCD